MNAIAKSSALLRRAALLAAVWCCLTQRPCAAAPSFVYETTNEFLASGDFNGDGVSDVLVLDKLTGNARVGYGNTNGTLTWSAPLVTGVGNATGCGVGRLLQTTRDAVAVTAPSFNEVDLVDLSATNTAGAPSVVTPEGLGPHTVVTLADPAGGAAPAYNDLLAASSDNAGSAEKLDLIGISAGVGTETGEYGESGPLDRGNALQLSVTATTFAAGLVRGSNDTLDIWQFTNTPGVMLSYSNLPDQSDYTFGIFNNETLPRFLFYQDGGSNVTVVPLQQSGASFKFGTALIVPVSEPIEGIFYQSLGTTNGSALILFSNGVQSLNLPGGSPVLGTIYGAGTGAAGNVFTGVVPLGNDQLALLDAPPGGTSSVHGQVLRFDGTNYTQLSSTNLPSTTARNTRANVWLFETEPFVNRSAQLVASYNTPDWSDGVSGLPGALDVSVQQDGGTSSGLGTIGTNVLGAPPSGSSYGLPNQYNAAISLFSYGSPQAAPSVTVTISPQPGIYDGPISISFTTLNASDKVYYRVGAADSWHTYAAAFQLTNDNTIEYYGTNASYNTRSPLQSAVYSLGINGQPTPTVNLTNGTSTTNPPPDFVGPTNVVTLSPLGTIFYGRRSTANTGTVWAINYDGSDDTYVTTGARPRLSRDGKWLAVMRGSGAFSNAGNIWLHNIQTGTEVELFNNTGKIVCYDWALDNSGLIMDYNCGLWFLRTNGVLTELIATDCYEESPVYNPVTGQISYDDVNPKNAGIYVANSDGTDPDQIINSVVPGASWPEWSPDGNNIAFTDNNSTATVDNGTNLWVTDSEGRILNQICDFNGTPNRFPHGAIWSPDSSSLVGAADLYGTNGLWIIPLNADRTDCMGPAILLPTTPGDAIDFAGSVVLPTSTVRAPILSLVPSTNGFVVVWSTNFSAYTLEYTYHFAPPIIWTPVPGPYTLAGLNFIYSEPFDRAVNEKIFRLVPNIPQVFLGVGTNSVTVYWPTNFSAYSLEYITNLVKPATWITIPGPYNLNGPYFEYTEPNGVARVKFFRLGP